MKQTEAIIYLAENRECIQTETFRSFITIPQNNIEEFNILRKFIDNTLAASQQNDLTFDGEYCILILPLVGAIEIINSIENKIINVGEIGYFFVRSNDELKIKNPYEHELINYIEVWIRSSFFEIQNNLIKEFDLQFNTNQLLQISNSKLNQRVYIGKFDGRREGNLNHFANAFVFVLNGVFEVNDRLLESRTGLLLQNINEIEFEGLGYENIILLIEV